MAKPGEPRDETALSPIPESSTPTVVLPGREVPGPDPAALLIGTAVGRYVILEPLGKGGMGVVYAAHDPELGRRVALKLLRPEVSDGESGSEGRIRLVREAHAMAKLNHPNVVAIYDSGVYGEQVFLAMELVEGLTAKAWLREAPRSWREILAVFLQAGRGLAAAHAVGLIHRDFKPENVLIGKGGAVKVTDFGIARAASADATEKMRGPAVAPAAVVDPLLATPVTRGGLASGTPAYMAPEQHLGGGDARTDEFSFCVALYRSLYDDSPFNGRLDPAAPKPVRPPPPGTRVPGWVRRPLLRGLSAKPEDRFPTLTELLEALADDPAVRRQRALAAAGMAAVVLAAIAGTALVLARRHAAADPCHDPSSQLTEVWDDSVRTRVRAAFAATGAADAASTVAYAERAMDRATNAWLSAYRDACQATRVRHAQPEAALNLRLDCLDGQRVDLRAAAEIMAHPEAKDLTAAIGAATTLPLPSECGDARALSVVEEPAPERRPQVDALWLKLARGRALVGAGRYREAVDALEGLPDEAASLESPYLQANALVALAGAHHWLNDYEKTIELNGRAESLAVAAHLDQLATQAAAAVAFDAAVLGRPQSEVDLWLNRAREDLRRAGAGGTAEYYVERAVEIAEHFRGHFAEAAAHARRALALAEGLYGSDSLDASRAVSNLAADVEPLGLYEEEIALFERAVASTDAVLGPRNQRALFPQLGRAEVLFDLGRAAEAGRALDNLFVRLGPDDRIQAASGLAVRAALQAEAGQQAESRANVGRAHEMAARLHLLSSPNWSDLHRYGIEASLRNGRPQAAIDDYETYLTHLDMPADSAGWVASLRLGGWAYLDAGQAGKAQPILERALRLSDAHPFYPGWVPRLRYQLARALVETHGDRQRAEALAQAAHDELVNVPVAKELAAELDAWRADAFKPR